MYNILGDKMEIYLIRHGQTEANLNMIIQGRANNPLNNTGKLQAKKTGEYLKRNHITFDYCVSSPLKRAINTLKIIKDELNIQIKSHIENQIIEREFGDLDGKRIPENYFNIVHSGLAKGMETDENIEKRVQNYFKTFFKNHNHKRVLMVAHSHVIKALLVQYTDNFTYNSYLNNCSITVIKYTNDIKIVAYNIDPLLSKNIKFL